MMDVEQELMLESLDIHNLTGDGVSSFLGKLSAAESSLQNRSLLSIVGNVLHGYFLFFTDSQKEALLTVLLSHSFGRNESFDRNELLSIMFKGAPSRCRDSVFALVAEGICDGNIPIQGLIANLNASRIIYDDLPSGKKKWLKEAVIRLHESRAFDPLVLPSIEYTIESMS